MDTASPVGDPVGRAIESPGEALTPELLAKLLPFLGESVMVVREGWVVVGNLTPPGGLTGKPKGPGSHALTVLHPDDALRLFTAGTAWFETEPGWTWSTTARLLHADGTYRRYDLDVTNQLDDPVLQGMVIRTRPAVGGDEAVLEAEREAGFGIEMFAELLPIGVLILSPSGRPLFANQVAAEVLSTTVEDLCAGGVAHLVDDRDLAWIVETIGRLGAAEGRAVRTFQPSGTDRLLEAVFASRTVRPDGAQPVIVTIQDVSHRQAREQLLEHRANHDALTGLANRAWLLDHLHARIREGDDLVVAFIDLDRFKAVNDRLGHLVGDAVLSEVATGLRDCLHPGELVARVGGDEFVIVSHDLDEDALADFGQRIRLAVSTVPAARLQDVGVSVGVARSAEGDEPWDLLRRADVAMYHQKRRRQTAH